MANPKEPAKPKHDPLVALKQAPFLFYSANRVCSVLAEAMMQAIIAWHVYEISGSALSLGFIGLARFFPALAVSMIGGAVADAYDRRLVIIASRIIPFIGSVVLVIATVGGWVNVGLTLWLSALMGMAMAFEGPARISLLPAVVRPETFENAVTVSNTMQKLSNITGPTLAGVLIAVGGPETAYAVYCVITVVAILPLLLLRYKSDKERRSAVSIASIKEGISFVFSRQVLLGAMTLDLFAFTLGGATALAPVYAKDILQMGPSGYGILQSSLQIGGFVAAFSLLMRRPVKRTGQVLIGTVIVFGLFTMLFGFAREFWVAVILYGLIGAADQISVVMRQTTIQMATPDELRGRVTSVNQVFVNASNQIGAVRAGFMAAITSAPFAVVSGGIGAILVALLVAWKVPDLYNYEVDRGSTTVEQEPEPVTTGPSPEPAPAART